MKKFLGQIFENLRGGTNLLLLTFIVLFNSRAADSSDNTTFFTERTIRIGLIYSSNLSTSWPSGWTALPTAQLALEMIQKEQQQQRRSNQSIGNATDGLGDGLGSGAAIPEWVEMEIVPIDSGCDKAVARTLVLDRIRDGDIDVFIGPPCTVESVDVVSFVAHPFFHNSDYQRPFLVATAAGYNREHDDETELYRKLVPNDFEFQHLQLIGERFNWSRYGIVYDSGISSILEDVRESAEGSLILSFFMDDSADIHQLTEDMEIFKDKDVKIIRSMLQSNHHGKMVCAAYRAGLMTSEYVWFIGEWTWDLIEQTLPDYCSDSEIERIKNEANSFLSFASDPSSIPGVQSDVGLTSEEVKSEIKTRLASSGSEVSSWDLYVYDCVWVIARSVEALLTSKSNSEKLADFIEKLDETAFYGVSGFVGFEGFNPASPHMRLDQWIEMTERVKVAQFSKAYLNIFQEIEWKDGRAPLDYSPKKEVEFVHETETVNKIAAIICNSGAALGILLCIVVMIVNFVYRQEKIIKITSPVINYFIISGSILLLVCVIAMSPTAVTLDTDIFVACCYVNSICLNIGFTMTFGALFAKTWRVYRAFSRRSAEKLTITDCQLVTTTLVLVLFDGVLLTMMLFFDPIGYESEITRQEVQIVDELRSTETTWTVLSCTVPANPFYYASAAFKCLMLLFGGFVAFETRKVHVDAVKDSKSIGVCMYNYTVSSVIGVVVGVVLDWQPTHSYPLLAPLILMLATFPILLLFAPRHLLLLVRSRKQPPPAVNVRKTTTAGTT